jgi:hypothetical protein
MSQDEHGRLPFDIAAALADPAAYFTNPRDVLATPGLSDGFKLKLLRKWEEDERRRAAANGGRLSVARAASHAAGEVGEAGGGVRAAAGHAIEGVVALRHFIRAQPITAGLLLFGVGYLAGQVATSARGVRRR